jgi:hypothetical protein
VAVRWRNVRCAMLQGGTHLQKVCSVQLGRGGKLSGQGEFSKVTMQLIKKKLIEVYISKNYRRVAEVWMDEYKDYVYMRRPGYKSIEMGKWNLNVIKRPDN